MAAIILAVISQQTIAWCTLAALGLIGLIALVSPKRFAALSQRSGKWIDTNKIAQVLDTRVDIDRYVLPFSRLLGVAVLASVAVLAYIVARYK